MPKRRREIQVFSVSFLDVLSCGLGGVLLVLLLSSAASTRKAEAARTRMTALERQASDELSRRNKAEKDLAAAIARSDKLQREKDELATTLRDLKRGISVPLPLAIQIHWEGAGDIDLSVVKDGDADKRIWYQNREADGSWGQLMRDETEGRTINSELFLAPRPEPGRYDVYVWYFGGGSQSQYTVKGEIALYPGDPARSQRKFVTVEVPRDPPKKWIRVVSYRLSTSGDGFTIEFLN